MQILLAPLQLLHIIAAELDNMIVDLGCQIPAAFQGCDF